MTATNRPIIPQHPATRNGGRSQSIPQHCAAPPRALALIDEIRDELSDVVSQAEALSDDLDTLARFVDFRGELTDLHDRHNGRTAA